MKTKIRAGSGGTLDARTLMAGSGELRIGAYARRQRIRNVLIAAGGVALIGVALLLYRALQPTEGVPDKRPLPTLVKCTACGARESLFIESSVAVPYECPRCHARAARPLWRCSACRTEFLAREGQSPVRCPNCNSVSVGTAAAP